MHPRFFLRPKLRSDFEAARFRSAAQAIAPNGAQQHGQLEALRTVWVDAVRDVPYYGSLVASGRAPSSIRSWDDVLSIPVLTRQAMQDRPHDFLRRSGPPDDFMKTAGSTGTPLRIGMRQAERDLMRIVKLSAWQEFGYSEDSRLFLIWGHAHLLGTGWAGRVNHVRRKVADSFLGYRRVDAYRLNEASCVKYADRLLRFHPTGVIGYASALDLFARYTQQFRQRFHALKLGFVLATAEPPPRPDTLPVLEELFGCPIVQEYGGAEFGQVAFKNGFQPFEVYSDLNYVECEQTQQDGEGAYPLLVTTLYPRYLPLIRYRVGDAVVSPDSLDNGHVTRFGAVAGRINDVITLDDGDSIHSVAIFHCIHQERGVHNIQMRLADDGLEVLLVATDESDPMMEARVRRRLAQVHPQLAKARITRVEDLQTSRAGKRRWFVDDRTDRRFSKCASTDYGVSNQGSL